MSLLEDRYYNNQEPDELELALQEAYEAGLSDGYNEALNEGLMNKLKFKIAKYKLKNKFNKLRKSDKAKYLAGALGGIALSHLVRKGLDRYNGAELESIYPADNSI